MKNKTLPLSSLRTSGLPATFERLPASSTLTAWTVHLWSHYWSQTSTSALKWSHLYADDHHWWTKQQLSIEESAVPSPKVAVRGVTISALYSFFSMYSTMKLCIISLCAKARLPTGSLPLTLGCSVMHQGRSAAPLPALLSTFKKSSTQGAKTCK